MHTEIWDHTGGKSRVMAIVRVDDGKLSIEEKEPMPSSYHKMIEMTQARMHSERAFLRQLEVEFSGSYVTATFKKD
jgi:hypothetical protein